MSQIGTIIVGSCTFDPTQRWFRASSYAALFQAADYMIALEPAVSAGRFELCERFKNRAEYVREVNTILIELRAKALVASPAANVQFMRYISALSKITKNLQLTRFDASLRRQPFGILIEGYPGTGKSGTAMKLAQALCAAQGKALKPSEIVVLNETDEFQSEYRSNHRVVIFDDVGATRSTLDGKDPWRKVIDFINNITKTSLNPHLELKGNILIRPELVICTTNLRIADGQTTSELTNVLNCPGAILRRFKACIKTESYSNWQYYVPSQTPSESSEYKPLTKYEVVSRDKERILKIIAAEYTAHCQQQDEFIETVNDGFAPETDDSPPTLYERIKGYFTKNKVVAQPAIVAQGAGEEVSGLRCFAKDYNDLTFEDDSLSYSDESSQYVSQSYQNKVTEAYKSQFDNLRLPFLTSFPATDLLKLVVSSLSETDTKYGYNLGLSKRGVFTDKGTLITKNFERHELSGVDPLYFYTPEEVCKEVARREESDSQLNHWENECVSPKIESELNQKETLIQEILSQFDQSSTLLPNGIVSVTINDFEFKIFPFVEYGMSAADARAFCKAMIASNRQFWFTIGHGPIHTNAQHQRAKTCKEFYRFLKELHPVYMRGLANMSKIRSLR